jgi:hypothetical protein
MEGPKVVWSDDRTGLPELYLKDVVTDVETPVSNNTGNQHRFISDQALSGTKLTWTNENEVWLKDIVTGDESIVASSTAHKGKSVCSGNKVFWNEYVFNVEDSIYSIYAKAEGESPILVMSSSDYISGNFSASGDKVIWTQYVNASMYVYLKDLSTGGTSIVAGPSREIWNAQITGNTVIWEDVSYADPTSRIYMKAVDIPGRPQIPIVTLPPNAYPLVNMYLSGDILVWTESTLGRTEIKCKSISTNAVASIASMTSANFWPSAVQVSIGYTAWFDNRDRGTSIYARSIDSTTLGEPAPVYRFYNFRQGVHFYTTNAEEKAYLEGPGGNWTFRPEGIGFEAQVMQLPGTVPVYRFYNFLQGAHFYTADQSEASYVNDNLWHTFRYEGIAYYAFPDSGVGRDPVYRFYNFLQGVHFYTTNEVEKNNLESPAGNWTFRYEREAYYVPQ